MFSDILFYSYFLAISLKILKSIILKSFIKSAYKSIIPPLTFRPPQYNYHLNIIHSTTLGRFECFKALQF